MSRRFSPFFTLLARLMPAALLLTAAVPFVGAQESAPAAPAAPETAAPAGPKVPDGWLGTLALRSVGPANMSGRITALCVHPTDPSIWYVATASGGLLKTVNNGHTFEHLFDREATVSLGDVCAAPSDPNIVWVGGGEANPRNSVSWGNGVYKSVDGGKTWQHKGLAASFQTGSVLVHPGDPNTVFVGALGRLWGPSEERGLFKTVDGGDNWEKVLFVDERTGVVDGAFKPDDPNTLIVATYERQRDGYDTNDPAKKWGPGGGLHKSVDGGRTWRKLTKGLPTSPLGRIGLDFYDRDPNIVFAIVECENIGKAPENAAYFGVRGEDADVGARLTEITAESPAAAAGVQKGDIVVSVDGVIVHSYAELLAQIRQRLAGDKVRMELSRERKTVNVEVTFGKRPSGDGADGARAGARPFGAILGGQMENVQAQQGPDGHEYGGVYRSADGGETWTRVNSLNPRPMYFSKIRVDPSDENYLWVLGVDLHRSKDGGKTFTNDGARQAHADHHALWINPKDGRHLVLGSDGGVYVSHDRGETWDHHNNVAIGQFYHVTVDARPNYRIYGGLQDNGSWGGPSRARHAQGPLNTDWFRVGGGDGFVCRVDREDPDQVYFTSQNGGMGRLNLRTGERGSIRPQNEQGLRFRWNWETPFILSHHNSRIFYCAANYVFRSLDRGRSLKRISPEISRTRRGSATDISESPLSADVIYVGSDDGALYVTRDGGAEWKPLISYTPEQLANSTSEGPGAEEEEPATQPASAPASQPESQPASAPAPQRRSRLQMLAEMDQNKDGRITRDEVSERMERLFDRVDANDDEVVDKAELDQALASEAAASASAPAPPAEPARPAAPPLLPELGAIRWLEAFERAGPARPAAAAAAESPAAPPQTVPVTPVSQPPAARGDDRISGVWEGAAKDENIPADQGNFTMTLRLDGAQLRGDVTSPAASGKISEGSFDAGKGTMQFAFDTDMGTVLVRGTLTQAGMSGEVEIAGAITVPFEATRSAPPAAEPAVAAAPVDEPPAALPASAAAALTERPAESQATERRERRRGRGVRDAIAAAAAGAAAGGQALGELLPGPRWVSSVEASRFKAGRVYVAFDAHKANDDEPYIFASEDHGATWKSVRGDLPTTAGATRVLREDLENENVLYLGCEFGAWVSVDRGVHWARLSGLPTVAVHDFAQHPTAGEVVLATHGRSLWILDVAPLRQLGSAVVRDAATLLKPIAATYWRREPGRGVGAAREFYGSNGDGNAAIYYALGRRPNTASLRVHELSGELIRELEVKLEPGLHAVAWDLRRTPEPAPNEGGRRRFGPPRGRLVPSGEYLVTLTVDGRPQSQRLFVQTDPEFPDYRPWAMEEALAEEGDAALSEREDDVARRMELIDW